MVAEHHFPTISLIIFTAILFF